MTEDPHPVESPATQPNRGWIYALLFVIILAAAAFLRLRGLYWGEYQYLHPDERFLLFVGSDTSPVQSLAEYWDTARSSLNPNNVGHEFYVYGTLPMFITRYMVQWIFGHSGLIEVTQVGRALSALADLGTVLLVYLIGARLQSRKVGLLAAAFSGLAVLQIQQSHFFTMDTFITFFATLTIYFAVRFGDTVMAWRSIWITSKPVNADYPDPSVEYADGPVGIGRAAADTSRESLNFVHRMGTGADSDLSGWLGRFTANPLFVLSLGFGLALGMAMASKVSAAPLALLLPAAMLVQLNRIAPEDRPFYIKIMFAYLGVAALVSFLSFRVFQPYAFTGPGFLGLRPNPAWLSSLKSLQELVSGGLGFPPNVQWADRPLWFSWRNMVAWGMGLPFGLLAWAGFLWAGWRSLVSWRAGTGEWRKHILLLGWTGFYFVWQSLPNNPTMRYQLPVYPTLAIFAAWAVFTLVDYGRSRRADGPNASGTVQVVSVGDPRLVRYFGVGLGVLVLASTAIYALGFSGIYVRPITRVEASRWIFQNIPGAINFHIQTDEGFYNQPHPFPVDYSILPEVPYVTSFEAREHGALTEVYLPHVRDVQGLDGQKTLRLTVARGPDQSDPLAQASVTSNLLPTTDERGQGYVFTLDAPVNVEADEVYHVTLALEGGSAEVNIEGATIAHEGSWDDPLPMRVDGYDGYGNIYQGYGLDMYEPDNPSKLDRYLNVLDSADYLTISSSRQWASLSRLPQRYPMTVVYYRALMGCPEILTVEACYNQAQPGDYQGSLGYELFQVFESPPNLGPIEINDQPSEEAFTVYDHPKVFVFRKSADYDPEQTRAILSSVDLSQVNTSDTLAPEEASREMLLPPARLAEQRSGGTWASLFDTAAAINRWPGFGLLVWYLVIFGLGLVVYPIVRVALSGLADKGYPLTRTVGLLISSYLVWLAGSLGLPASRLTITAVIALLVLISALFAYRQRESLRTEWRSRRKYFLLVEGLFLAFFAFDLLIRLGNPDLWHPWKGGEKPMDFSYFNAVLKSSTFPPYDPWFSGGYINYYYYGFVFVGVMVKWLGIVPSIAYNLIIPTVFALIGLGAFSLGWNLLHRREGVDGEPELPERSLWGELGGRSSVFAGIAASLGMAVLGNLGTLRMIFHGYQKLAAPDGMIEGASILVRWVWAVRGFFMTLSGDSMPYALADWYWIPSRAIPAPNEVEPITEFPFFTVLYGDPHAHLFALPLALLALAWGLSVVFGRAWSREAQSSWAGAVLNVGVSLLLGAMAIGALWPTNTWDLPTYLALGLAAVIFAVWHGTQLLRDRGAETDLPSRNRGNGRKILLSLGGVILLGGLAFLFYRPYAAWYVQGYTSVELWKGTHTPIWSYLTHWGLFLFVIVSWMAWETRQWMASTPLSALRKLQPYKSLITGGLLMLLVWIAGLLYLEVEIAWLVLPLAAWSGLLLLRPNMPTAKRVVLFLVGSGLMLTLMVEVIVLKGDIARMNTVFKFYLQVWTLFAVSAAAAFAWILDDLRLWSLNWRAAWNFAVIALVASAALYPLLGGVAKVKDRMSEEAPHTLDGMAFMQHATYTDLETTMDLSQDYRAIRWMQENVIGSPVIVEGNMPEYHWGTRFTIYTGLPNVIGWNWHQRQQRAASPDGTVSERVSDVSEFYLTTSFDYARDFLREYEVAYVIVGQLERALYPGPGLEKFTTLTGALFQEVYREGETVIYRVTQG